MFISCHVAFSVACVILDFNPFFQDVFVAHIDIKSPNLSDLLS